MKFSLLKVLSGIIILDIVLFIFTYFFPVTVLRAVLGIPFILFVPGFVLLSALIPKRDDMITSERLILSFVLSIIADSCIGLVLNYTPFGITLTSIIVSETVFVLLISVIGVLRQLVLSPGEQSHLEFNLRLVNPASGALNATLTVVMILIVIGALATGIYYSFAPQKSIPYTQFYVVQQVNGALYSAENATTGNGVKITLGLENNEGAQVNYKVQALINGVNNEEINSILLASGQKWQDSFTLPALSDTQTEVEFQLYKNNETKPYLEPLRVWIDARKKSIVSQ